jgi:hypothetical protein
MSMIRDCIPYIVYTCDYKAIFALCCIHYIMGNNGLTLVVFVFVYIYIYIYIGAGL